LGSVGRIKVREEGERAEGLLGCLRAKAAQYNVRIEAGTSGTLGVDDLGGYTDDLPGFLRAQLEVCSAELDYTVQSYMGHQHYSTTPQDAEALHEASGGGVSRTVSREEPDRAELTPTESN
jgi:hypothetical protein